MTLVLLCTQFLFQIYQNNFDRVTLCRCVIFDKFRIVYFLLQRHPSNRYILIKSLQILYSTNSSTFHLSLTQRLLIDLFSYLCMYLFIYLFIYFNSSDKIKTEAVQGKAKVQKKLSSNRCVIPDLART